MGSEGSNGILYFSDVHVASQESLDELVALSALSKEMGLDAISGGDTVDAQPILEFYRGVQSATASIGELSEDEQKKVMQQIQEKGRELDQGYQHAWGVVNEVFGQFHGGKVYGVVGNHDHPLVVEKIATNLEQLEGRVVEIAGRKFTGIEHYSARFFDQQESETPWGNIDSKLGGYQTLIDQADVVVMHEGAHKDLAHKGEYHKGLGEMLEKSSIDILCGHVHSKYLSEEKNRTLMRAAPGIAYVQQENNGVWDTYEVDVKGLAKAMKEQAEPQVAGKIGDYKQAA